MKRSSIFLAALLLLALYGTLPMEARSLKDALGKYFAFGVALSDSDVKGDSLTHSIITTNFDNVVAENCMKPEAIQPKEGKFRFRRADRFVDFARCNGMEVTGHCLVWNEQTPAWFFTDSLGNPASRDLLISRMKSHIMNTMGHFRGKVKGWDVVNEAFGDDGQLKHTRWYDIIGPDYIELAFRFAQEADPDAELYYNDFSMAGSKKREAVCRMVRDFKEKGIRIDAIGMQSHVGLTFPDLSEYEKSIEAFAAEGVKVMITELDLNVLPNPDNFSGANITDNFEYSDAMNPYRDGLPQDVAERIDRRWAELFTIYIRHADVISRVNLWGLDDGGSWLNNFPIKGRTAYPLLFDRHRRPKGAVELLMNM